MSTYGWILGISLLVPLIFFFYPKFGFYKNFGRVIFSSVIVAVPFLIWDAMAVIRGDWGFSEKHVGPVRISGLPIEEILFFIIIPFCCLFVWFLIEKYLGDKKIEIPKILLPMAGVSLVILLFIFWSRFYTRTIIIWSLITILVGLIFDRDIYRSRNYWRWVLITMVPFVLVNGVLTYLPVVWYSSWAIIGVRLVSIPIEDFLYSWSLVTLNLVVYRKLSRL